MKTLVRRQQKNDMQPLKILQNYFIEKKIFHKYNKFYFNKFQVATATIYITEGTIYANVIMITDCRIAL